MPLETGTWWSQDNGANRDAAFYLSWSSAPHHPGNGSDCPTPGPSKPPHPTFTILTCGGACWSSDAEAPSHEWLNRQRPSWVLVSNSPLLWPEQTCSHAISSDASCASTTVQIWQCLQNTTFCLIKSLVSVGQITLLSYGMFPSVKQPWLRRSFSSWTILGIIHRPPKYNANIWNGFSKLLPAVCVDLLLLWGILVFILKKVRC